MPTDWAIVDKKPLVAPREILDHSIGSPKLNKVLRVVKDAREWAIILRPILPCGVGPLFGPSIGIARGESNSYAIFIGVLTMRFSDGIGNSADSGGQLYGLV